GMALISHATILPLFVGRLTTSRTAVGAVAATMYLGWFLPCVLVAGRIERLRAVRGWVMAVAVVERLALLVMVPLILGLGAGHRHVLLLAFFGCWLTSNAAVGCNTPAYYKLIAKTISPRLRGRLYGVGGALAGLLGILGGGWAGWMLDRYGYPAGFAGCFAAAFAVL